MTSWTRHHERWTRVGFVQLELSTSWLKMAAVIDGNQGEYLALNRSFFTSTIFHHITLEQQKQNHYLLSHYPIHQRWRHDDEIYDLGKMFVLFASRELPWLPSRDHEFTSWMERCNNARLARCVIYARALLKYVIFISWVRSYSKMFRPRNSWKIRCSFSFVIIRETC